MGILDTTKKFAITGLMGMSLVFTGCLTDDDDDTDTTTPANKTAWSSATNVRVGGQGHLTLGSALDLDDKEALLSAAANAALETVDLVFVFSGGSVKLMNTQQAKAAGDVQLALNYDDSKTTDVTFVEVSAKPANVEAGTAAYDAGTKLRSVVVTAGKMYVVKTAQNNFVLLTITSISANANDAEGNLAVQISSAM